MLLSLFVVLSDNTLTRHLTNKKIILIPNVTPMHFRSRGWIKYSQLCLCTLHVHVVGKVRSLCKPSTGRQMHAKRIKLNLVMQPIAVAGLVLFLTYLSLYTHVCVIFIFTEEVHTIIISDVSFYIRDILSSQ